MAWIPRPPQAGDRDCAWHRAHCRVVVKVNALHDTREAPAAAAVQTLARSAGPLADARVAARARARDAEGEPAQGGLGGSQAHHQLAQQRHEERLECHVHVGPVLEIGEVRGVADDHAGARRQRGGRGEERALRVREERCFLCVCETVQPSHTTAVQIHLRNAQLAHHIGDDIGAGLQAVVVVWMGAREAEAWQVEQDDGEIGALGDAPCRGKRVGDEDGSVWDQHERGWGVSGKTAKGEGRDGAAGEADGSAHLPASGGDEGLRDRGALRSGAEAPPEQPVEGVGSAEDRRAQEPAEEGLDGEQRKRDGVP